MKWARGIFFCAALVACACLAAQETPEGRLLRFPDMHGGKIVFVYRRRKGPVSDVRGPKAGKPVTSDQSQIQDSKFKRKTAKI